MKFLATVLFVLALLVPSKPEVSISGKTFTATFDKGAVYANVAYQNKESTSYDNYFLSTQVSSLTDEISESCDKCTMVVSIGYPSPDPNNPGTTDVNYVESDTITIN